VQEPRSVEETAERYVRPQLRRAFVDLCKQPISHYLEKFEFKSDLIKAMYATTDAFSGLSGGWDTPGTGMNFLVHNMCVALLSPECSARTSPRFLKALWNVRQSLESQSAAWNLKFWW
jgi:hypothetical protein